MTRLEKIVAGGLLALTLVSCGKKEAPPPAPPPSRPTYTPPPPPPQPVNTDQLLQAMGADARVQFPESHAPTDESFARAVISLGDALARGDETKMRAVLTQPAQGVLDELVGSGAWYDATGEIEAVRVVELDGAAHTVTLAVQDPDGAYVLKWRGRPFGGSYAFEGESSPKVERGRATDFDAGVPQVQEVSQASAQRGTLLLSPLGTWASVELFKAIDEELGGPADEDELLGRIASATGRTDSAVRSAYDQGSTASARGDELDEAEMARIVNYFTGLPEVQGELDRDRIMELLAQVLGLSRLPDLPEPEDTGEIIKRTPAGPVRIPTRDRPPPP